MTLTQYRQAFRALHLAGVTRDRVGRDGWAEAVKDQIRLTTSMTPRRTPFEPIGEFLTMDRLKAYQAKQREIASRISPAELRRAEALGDLREEVCPKCDGAQYVAARVNEGALATAVPCECMPLEERARRAGIPQRFYAATIASAERRKGQEEAIDFARRWDGRRSVLLYGNNGTGKTRLGCGLLLSRLESGATARYIDAADLMDNLRARFGSDEESSQSYLFHVSNEPLLMLDDVGSEQRSDYTIERMATLINRRYNDEAPTVITTNLVHKEIAERYGRRLADRLYEWKFVEMAGGSVRRERAAS
jgi:DNA replication protein DnaC